MVDLKGRGEIHGARAGTLLSMQNKAVGHFTIRCFDSTDFSDVVITPNVTGSTGYGQAFTDAIR
jgi:hypothetical protein